MPRPLTPTDTPLHQRLMDQYGFGLFALPRYRPVEFGDWRIRIHLPAMGKGYLGASVMESRAVLTHRRRVWMSTCLLEQESHAWHVHCARGTVVIAGLGMGMYAYAIAMKPEVERVIVADISPDIIALMRQSTGFDDWPRRDKVTLIEADVLAPDFADRIKALLGETPIDYLYADIWPNFPADEAPAQTAAMARALQPRAAGWWGQELSFARHCLDTEAALDETAFSAYFAGLGVPAPKITAGYAAFAKDAAKANGITSSISLWSRLRAFFQRN